ncbi:MAG TPA: class I SAM-dependent RNA methyltransferase [Bacteroidales bacterium]|nr:class I SAM-dependent RNA methyltransferase [Bacteroidales bacterium]
MKLIAKTLYGLEKVLAEELINLGAGNVEISNRAVLFDGDVAMMYRANYCCRTALSILMQVAEFQIRSKDDLYKKSKKIEWDKYLEIDDTFSIMPVVSSRLFPHTGYAGLVLKDAIADWFRDKKGQRPSVDTTHPEILFNLHISNERVNISVDSSVIPLYKRGYRQSQAVAPLNEVLAAGIVLLSGWDKGKPLLDPMCGSGTLLIEAALIACRIPPGKFRKSFGFQKWKNYDEQLFDSIKKESDSKITVSPAVISGKDISEKVLMQAQANIDSAGLSEVISVEVSDFQYLKASTDDGFIIMNPPYGTRIRQDEIDRFYSMIGSTLKHSFTGNNVWLITSNKEALKNVGLKLQKKITLYNGALECVLVNYQMYSGTRKDKTT